MSDQESTVTPNDVAPSNDNSEVDQWKANSRKWEERSKANKAELDKLAAERDELAKQVEAAKTASEELTGKVEAFEAEKARNALVAKVSEDTGVPASALRGDTEDELKAHASELAKLIGSTPSAPVIKSQGKAPGEIAGEPLRDLARDLFKTAREQG